MTTQAVKFPDNTAYRYAPMWQDDIDAGRCTLLTGRKAQDALETHRRRELKRFIKPGQSVTVVETTNNAFRVFVVHKHQIREITRAVADLCGHRTNKRGDITMGGYGYSKSFQIVYGLGRALWPHGTRKPHGTRNGQPDTDGGYALKEA